MSVHFVCLFVCFSSLHLTFFFFFTPDMCQHLYNQQSLSLLQSTLVELPATFLNSSNPTSPAHSALSEGKSPSPLVSTQQDCVDLSVSTVKLCIPAANFSHIINPGERKCEVELSLTYKIVLLNCKIIRYFKF